jgi:DNA-binding NarL/FixJ family response regulator
MRDESHHRSGAIKVLIAEVPALLAAVIQSAVNEEPDMEVVKQVGSGRELANALHQPIDVVITASTTTELPPQFHSLLFGSSPVPIVTISLDGRRIDVYGRSINRGRGIEGLARLIREAVAGTQHGVGG